MVSVLKTEVFNSTVGSNPTLTFCFFYTIYMKNYIYILICFHLINLFLNLVWLCMFFLVVSGYFTYLDMHTPLERWSENYFLYFYFFFKINLLVYIVNNFVPCLIFYFRIDTLLFIRQEFLNASTVSNYVTKTKILTFLETCEYVLFVIIAYFLVSFFTFL